MTSIGIKHPDKGLFGLFDLEDGGPWAMRLHGNDVACERDSRCWEMSFVTMEECDVRTLY